MVLRYSCCASAAAAQDAGAEDERCHAAFSIENKDYSNYTNVIIYMGWAPPGGELSSIVNRNQNTTSSPFLKCKGMPDGTIRSMWNKTLKNTGRIVLHLQSTHTHKKLELARHFSMLFWAMRHFKCQRKPEYSVILRSEGWTQHCL